MAVAEQLEEQEGTGEAAAADTQPSGGSASGDATRISDDDRAYLETLLQDANESNAIEQEIARLQMEIEVRRAGLQRHLAYLRSKYELGPGGEILNDGTIVRSDVA